MDTHFTSETAPPHAQPPTRARRSRREWALFALVWLLLAACAGYALWSTRVQLVAQDLGRLAGQTRAIESSLTRQLQGVSNALAGVRYELIAGDTTPQLDRVPARLKMLTDAMPGVGTLHVLDARGITIAASRRELMGKDFHQREYFTTARDIPDPTVLRLSRPFRSILGRYATVLTRTMISNEGQFAGLVVASLDADYFETVLRSAVYAQDAQATIVHGDGTIIVSAPAQATMPGLNLNQPGSMFRQHLESRQASSTQQGLLASTGEHRLMATRNIAPAELRMDHPLVVRVSRSTADVLQSWRYEAGLQAMLLALGLAASGACLFWHQHRRGVAERAAHAAARAERDSARRLEFGLRGADLGLWEWNLASDTVTVNAREREMLGLAPTQKALSIAFWRDLLHPDDRAAVQAAMRQHLRGASQALRVEHRVRHTDGRWIWVLSHAMVMEHGTDGRPQRVVGTHLDISARKQSQLELERLNAQLEMLSLTDVLTGVANRRQFDQALALEWARSLRQGQPLALLMIDVDHFKLYNDRLGHPEGDACLRSVAQLLSMCLRQPVEQLMRYGGEEFAVLLTDADAQAGAVVAQRCLAAVASARLPHPCSPVGPYVTLSIGVAGLQATPEHGAERLVHAADLALYEAKRQGRARCVLSAEADHHMLPT